MWFSAPVEKKNRKTRIIFYSAILSERVISVAIHYYYYCASARSKCPEQQQQQQQKPYRKVKNIDFVREVEKLRLQFTSFCEPKKKEENTVLDEKSIRRRQPQQQH